MHTYTQVHMNVDIDIDIDIEEQEFTQSYIILSKRTVQRDYMK